MTLEIGSAHHAQKAATTMYRNIFQNITPFLHVHGKPQSWWILWKKLMMTFHLLYDDFKQDVTSPCVLVFVFVILLRAWFQHASLEKHGPSCRHGMTSFKKRSMSVDEQVEPTYDKSSAIWIPMENMWNSLHRAVSWTRLTFKLLKCHANYLNLARSNKFTTSKTVCLSLGWHLLLNVCLGSVLTSFHLRRKCSLSSFVLPVWYFPPSLIASFSYPQTADRTAALLELFPHARPWCHCNR